MIQSDDNLFCEIGSPFISNECNLIMFYLKEITTLSSKLIIVILWSKPIYHKWGYDIPMAEYINIRLKYVVSKVR